MTWSCAFFHNFKLQCSDRMPPCKSLSPTTQAECDAHGARLLKRYTEFRALQRLADEVRMQRQQNVGTLSATWHCHALQPGCFDIILEL